MTTIILSLSEVDVLTNAVLLASGASEANARSVTESVVSAEADGIHSHGLARLPTYCEHLRCGKVDGMAVPVVDQIAAASFRVNAKDGFAHPAIDLGLASLIPVTRKTGIATLVIMNSYNCGIVGYHVERIAKAGLVALGFAHSPASIAPWGGMKAVFGTNPIACAAPLPSGEAIVIDQSSSVVAKSELMVRANAGEGIPIGWALDSDGNGTTDPNVALAGGTMVPSGGYKGVGIAFIVEILAACVTGATLSANASSYGDNTGGPTRTGQMFIAMEPSILSGSRYSENIASLVATIVGQEGARLPGTKRLNARKRAIDAGVTLSKKFHDRLQGYLSRL